MPKLDGILETAIHTENVPRARAFYEDILGCSQCTATTACRPTPWRARVLLVLKGTATQTVALPSGTVPGAAGRASCAWRLPSARTN